MKNLTGWSSAFPYKSVISLYIHYLNKGDSY
jgi:hypothetical protein